MLTVPSAAPSATTPQPSLKLRGAEKLVFVRDEVALLQRDAEVSSLLVCDDRAEVWDSRNLPAKRLAISSAHDIDSVRPLIGL